MVSSQRSGRRRKDQIRSRIWLWLALGLPAAACGTNLGGLPVDADPEQAKQDARVRPPPIMVDSPDAAPPIASPPDAMAADRVPTAGPDCPATNLQPNPMCTFGYHALKRATPEVVLVFDRSSAMLRMVPGTTQSRWGEMMAAVESNVMRTHAGMQWGLKLFPSTTMCNVTEPLDVPVRLTNFEPLTMRIRGTMPTMGPEGSPLDLGIKRAASAFRAMSSTNPRYLVLATDGVPNCPVGIPGETEAVKAVAVLEQQGLRSFVIGTATPASPQHRTLNDLAAAGGESRAGNQRYYQALNKLEMQKALDEITNRLVSCVLVISNNAQPPAPDFVALNIGNTRVPRDPGRQEGWNWGGAPLLQTVHVYGSYCATLMSNPLATAELVFGCPGPEGGHFPPVPPPCAGGS